MKIKWLGHSAFLLTAADGTSVITDPYTPGSFSGQIRYDPICETADAVTISHHHHDHDGVSHLPGEPKVLEGTGTFKAGSIGITGFETFHDANQGAGRGRNTVFVFEADGLRVCHCGDLGHVLTAEQAAAIGKVDALLVPVGGTFTVDAAAAHEVAGQLAARVTIPMHYKTDKLGFDIARVDDFVQGRANVKRVGSPEVEVSADKLPSVPEIWVLEHAL
ncbi:MAG: MBL fold metallo-hydrolase [candidate division WOR-3 bacterium]|nr:MBL fold metallo-hydrolase [candidate division WOR-3 bacterium]